MNTPPALDPQSQKIQSFRNQVEEAFNLCCPSSQCRGVLAPIEGCNAATCEKCGAKFCYLCLEPQRDSGSAHAHARKHSGNYWEHRDGHTGHVPAPGQGYAEVERYFVTETDPHTGKRRQVEVMHPYTYTDRYHWQLVMEKLSKVFQEESDSGVKVRVLADLEPMLRKNKMWPLPFDARGEKEVEAWIQEVMRNVQLDQKNRIALIQNWHIYLTQQAKKASLDAEKSARLDQAQRVSVVLLQQNSTAQTSLDVGTGVVATLQNNNVTPLLADHPDEAIRHLYRRIQAEKPAFFAHGGNEGHLYRIVDPAGRVEPFVLTAELGRGNHQKALDDCAAIGATAPTVEQLYALSRAMRGPDGRYDRNLIAGMSGTRFWSSSGDPYIADLAFNFYGDHGLVISDVRNSFNSVRCACGAAAW